MPKINIVVSSEYLKLGNTEPILANGYAKRKILTSSTMNNTTEIITYTPTYVYSYMYRYSDTWHVTVTIIKYDRNSEQVGHKKLATHWHKHWRRMPLCDLGDVYLLTACSNSFLFVVKALFLGSKFFLYQDILPWNFCG